MKEEKENETAEKGTTILLNGKEKEVPEKLTYEQILELAFPGNPINPDFVYTVKYKTHRGEPEKPVTAGETVQITKGMIINVSRFTNKS